MAVVKRRAISIVLFVCACRSHETPQAGVSTTDGASAASATPMMVSDSGPSPPQVHLAMPTVTGGLPSEIVQRTVRHSLAHFRHCYESALPATPGLHGRVIAKFVIDGDGNVATPSDDGSDIGDPTVIQCVLGEIGKLQFPKPASGTVSVVTPFLFTPGSR
jgi:hypothetical protein